MKITKVCCQGCGADLQVDEDVRYVTCNYCHARLEVVHDPSVTHTRLMEKLEKTTDQMAANLKVIALQNDLERLDREWSGSRENFMMTGRNGSRSVPTRTGSVAGGIIGLVFIVIWIGLAASSGAPGPFVLFGVVIGAFIMVNMVRGTVKATDFEGAESTYRQRRAEIVRELEEARRQ
ncbi:hypothetical protein [Luteolibacter marinus]|uniref:hypothetical protein n=1 Tax=Luteolibacter marinus TaxID=2776705 RepID=UPI00186769AB|nr:hypothetical protein [Luteolibacter marinus]